MVQPIDIRQGADGVPIISGTPRWIGVSLALVADTDRRWISVDNGLVVFRGVDTTGQPVELRYRVVGFRPADPGAETANEGGFLLCERAFPRPARPAPEFVVHVAGVPGADHVQRCGPCGAVLLNGRPWVEGRMAVPDGQPHEGPTWWPTGALVATDKPHDGAGGGMTYAVQAGRALDADEKPCTPQPGVPGGR